MHAPTRPFVFLLIASLALNPFANSAESIGDAFTKTIDVDFTDATLGDVAAYLEEALSPSVNVVVDNAASTVLVDRIGLQEANLLTVLSLLIEMTPGLQVGMSLGGAFFPLAQLESFMPVDSENFRSFATGKRVTVLLSGAQLKPGQSQMGVQVYNVGPLMQHGMDHEALIAAIEAAGEATSGPAATIKFHDGSRLLVCAGNPAKLAVIDQVIVQLDAGPEVVMQSLLMRQNSESRDVYRTLASGASITQGVREAQQRANHLSEVNVELRHQITTLQQQLTEVRLEAEIAAKRHADDYAALEAQVEELKAEK
jgi:hypothetical protein